jgi:hypothetical protein
LSFLTYYSTGQYGLPRLRALCESTIEVCSVALLLLLTASGLQTNFAFDDLDSVLSLLAMAETYRVRSPQQRDMT